MHRYVFFSKWYADFLLLCHWRYILPQSYHSRPSISIHKSPLSIEKQVSCACNLDGNLWRWRALWIPVGYCCCCLSSVWRSGLRTTPGPRTRLDQDQSSKAAVENVWSWSLNFEKMKGPVPGGTYPHYHIRTIFHNFSVFPTILFEVLCVGGSFWSQISNSIYWWLLDKSSHFAHFN